MTLIRIGKKSSNNSNSNNNNTGDQKIAMKGAVKRVLPRNLATKRPPGLGLRPGSGVVKATVALGKKKRTRRYRLGQKALSEIRKEQKSTTSIINRTPMDRIIREIMSEYNPELRLQGKAVDVIREATEQYGIQIMKKAMLCGFHAGRITLYASDMRLAVKLNGSTDFA